MADDGPTYHASCRCGGVSATATGTPTRISICHCLDCQKRAGSAFAAQVRFRDVMVKGTTHVWRTTGDSGRWAEFQRCATCGDQIAFRIEYFPDMTAIPLGAFEDPRAFTPEISVWESRQHAWLDVTAVRDHG